MNFTDKHENYKHKFKLKGGGMTYSFKDYFYNDRLFEESPNMIHGVSDGLDEPIYNSEQALMIMKNSNHVGDIMVNSKSLLVFSDSIDNVIEYYLIDENKGHPVVASYLELKLIHSGKDIVQIKFSWNNKRLGRGYFWELFNKYVIHKYSIILSDNNFTKQARDFWENLIIRYNEIEKDKFSTFVSELTLKNKQYIEYVDGLPEDIYNRGELVIGIENNL